MSTKFFKTNFLSLGMLSVFSVTPLFVGAMSANAQATSPGTNQSPTQTAPGATTQPAPGTTITEPAPGTTITEPAPGTTTQPAPGATITEPAPGTTNTQPNTLGNYSPENAPLLALGSRGTTVRDIQTFLNAQGLYNGPIDGIYGVQTRSAVVRFQQNNNLIADGVIGSQTWGAMLNQTQQQSSAF